MSLKTATNRHYDAHRSDWALGRDFYEAEDVSTHLVQGKYESMGAYHARRRQADVHPYTRQILGRLSDQLLLRADEVGRELGPIPGSYVESAGPDGESHNLQMHTLANYLLLYGEAWLQVRPADSGSELRVLSPLTVPRWKDQQVLTIGEAAKPGVPLSEDEEVDTTYTVHTPFGYTTYMFQENETGEEKRVQVDSGTYSPTEEERFFVDGQGNPTPPLARIVMPWDATLGVQLAKTHLQMYRLESQIDGRLHTALTSGQLVYNGLDADGEEKVIHSHKKGQNLLFLPEDADVSPMQVPTGAVEMGEKRLSNKEDSLYQTAYETLREESGTMTATEAASRNASEAAAVATLAATIESAETTVLPLVAQSYNLIDLGGPAAQDPGVSSNWTDIGWANANLQE
ncbi:DUF4055 domain-containing protein [Salinibacter ruber]|uniref:DUF4055 domain-containing protein n=1 Tax=Salinibacter ruber TaxID=146919 RepID=UPI0020730920|nr:DUF4055 domain-containing protein [Salinibacter ruber]